jgi:hypothetical protein
MLLSAAVLADCGTDDLQQRTLARYAFLWGEALLECLRVWRNRLKRVDATRSIATAGKPHIDALATALKNSGAVRHHLAAKRQSVAAMRADDIEATAQLWLAVNPANVTAICTAAINGYDALDAHEGSNRSIIAGLALPADRRDSVREALPGRDFGTWHMAADTAADLRPFTLVAAQGGELGRLIAQINDVAGHLDVLLRTAPVVYGVLPYDWLIRSALMVELNALLDLALGPPPNGRRTVLYSLTDRCRQVRATAAAVELERLASSIDAEGWDYVRWMRNRVGAHVDTNLTLSHIHEHLAQLDYRGIVRLAEHVLDWLDALGAAELNLKLLALGERQISSWPADATNPPPGAPNPAPQPGVLAHLFRSIDSPFMIVTNSSLGSSVAAGITAGRRPAPRPKVDIPQLPEPLSMRQLPAALPS